MRTSSISPLRIQAQNLTKIFVRGQEEVKALDQATFEISQGEYLALIGPSGSGKTTLLNLLGCMDNPTSGILRFNNREIQSLSDQERTLLRRNIIGFVFQHFGLIPTLSVAENIELPRVFAKRSTSKTETDLLLEKVGLLHRRKHRPHELSGGEMQRVAIARALINGPSLLLADEPTGNLDSATGETISTLFNELHRDGLTIVVATHNSGLAGRAQKRLEVSDGRVNLS